MNRNLESLRKSIGETDDLRIRPQTLPFKRKCTFREYNYLIQGTVCVLTALLLFAIIAIKIKQIGWPTSAFLRIQSALFHIRTYALVVVACTCFTGYVSLDCELVDRCKYLVDNCLFRHFGGLWYFVMGVQQIIMAKKEFLEE